MKIVLDTNILIYAAKAKVDLFRQLREYYGGAEIVIPNLIKQELEKLAENAKKGADKKAAKFALRLLEFGKIKEIKLEGDTDSEILKWAKKNKAVVATNDFQFRKALKEGGVLSIHLKQNKFLKS